jgi:hypothetical protein
MAGTVIADNLQAAATSTLVIKNGVANTPPTIQDSAGTTIGTFCRAWVNFNGTGTVAIRASFNVSSITDNGTGNYTVNFTTAMPDVNYSGLVTAGDYGAAGRSAGGNTNATRLVGSYDVATLNAAQSSRTDCDTVYVAIFR